MKVTFKINDERTQFYAKRAIEALSLDKTHIVVIQPETRTLANNAAQWPILNAFAEQLHWPVNGHMAKLDAEEWKDILTAAYKQETVKLAMGLNGGVVILGKRTREFKRAEWSEWMAFLESVAADRGVKIPLSKRRCEAMGYE